MIWTTPPRRSPFEETTGACDSMVIVKAEDDSVLQGRLFGSSLGQGKWYHGRRTTPRRTKHCLNAQYIFNMTK